MSAHRPLAALPVLASLALTPAAALTLAGCDGVFDPYDRPGTLRADAATTANVSAMAANPYDLARGHGSPDTDGQAAAAAVERARRDAVTPLLSGGGAAALSGATASTVPTSAPLVTP
ncbi:MAG: hypothetical protein INR65_04105 [Gluconacetobacter diazotrophicus]|nr:hypothetical protein [Gluconacetobacter diazotrophicus]